MGPTHLQRIMGNLRCNHFVLVPVLLLFLFLPPDHLELMVDIELDDISRTRLKLAEFVLLTALCAVSILRSERVRWFHYLYPLMLFAVFGRLNGFSIIDDAYISLRYALNFSDGHGLVFNPGEPVEGYTSPGWVLTIGMARKVFGADPALLAFLLSTSSGLAVLVAFYYCSRVYVENARWRLFTALFFSSSFCVSFWSFSGMEASFYTLLLILWINFLAKGTSHKSDSPRHLLLASCVSALAVITRPEAILLFPFSLFYLQVFLKHHQSQVGFLRSVSAFPPGKVKLLLIYALPTLLVLIFHFTFRYSYYESLLPNTFHAKVGSSLLDTVNEGWLYMVDMLAAHSLFVIAAALGFMKLPGIVGRNHSPLHIWASPLLAVTAIMLSILYTGADGFIEYRYFYYLMPFLGYSAVFYLSSAFGQRGNERRSSGKVATILPLAFLVISIIIPYEYRKVGYVSLAGGSRYAKSWAKAGRWLRANASEGATVAAFPVGAIGYYSRLKMIDMHGLTDKHIARQKSRPGPKDHQKYDGAYVSSLKPDYIYIWQTRIDSWDTLMRSVAASPPAYSDLFRSISERDYKILNVKTEGEDFCFLERRNTDR